MIKIETLTRGIPFLLAMISAGCELVATETSTTTSVVPTFSGLETTESCDSPFYMPATLFPTSDIQGSWSQACLSVSPSNGYNAHSLREVLSFSGTSMIITTTLYEDTTCQVGYFRQKVLSTFVLGSASSAQSTTSRKLDFTLSSITVEPLSTHGASDLNTNAVCGLTNHAVGASQEITSRVCSGETQPAVGTTLYTIVKADTHCNALALGYPGPSTSIYSRPTALWGSSYDYHK